MRTSLLHDNEPYVFVSRIKPFNLKDGFTRRPDHFRAVDDTLFRPANTVEENAQESERVSKRLQQFILDVRREPEQLLEGVPAFAYQVPHKGAKQVEQRTWPAVDVLQRVARAQPDHRGRHRGRAGKLGALESLWPGGHTDAA